MRSPSLPSGRSFAARISSGCRQLLKAPVIFDGRNLYDPAMVSRFGLTYYAIGRGKLPAAA